MSFAAIIGQVLATVLWSYQRRWADLFGAKRFLGLLGGRQIGKDFVFALLLLLDALFNVGAEWHVISATQAHAEQFIRDVNQHLRFIQELAAAAGFRLPELAGDPTKTRIAWKNGSLIESHAATLRAVIGRRGSFLMNEYALIPNAREIFETGYSMVRRAQQMGKRARFIVISNASARGTDWHRWWTERDPEHGGSPGGWHMETAPWSECMTSLGWTEAQIKAERGEIIADLGGSDGAFGQWFECLFRSGSDALFPVDLLDRQGYDPGKIIMPDDAQQVIGYDVGRIGDPTAFAPIVLGKKAWALETDLLRNVDFDEQRRRLLVIAKSRPTRRVIVDAVGIGLPIYEKVEKVLRGTSAVTGFKTSSGGRFDKWELFSALRDALDGRKLWVPRSDVDLRMELEAVTTAMTASDKVRVDLPRTQRGHGDRAFALALGNHAAQAPSPGRVATGKKRSRALMPAPRYT